MAATSQRIMHALCAHGTRLPDACWHMRVGPGEGAEGWGGLLIPCGVLSEQALYAHTWQPHTRTHFQLRAVPAPVHVVPALCSAVAVAADRGDGAGC